MLMLVMQMLYTCYIHVICYICYITYDICYIQSATVCSTGPRPAQGMLQFPKKLGHCLTLPFSLDTVSKGFCLFVLIHVVPGFLAILRPEHQGFSFVLQTEFTFSLERLGHAGTLQLLTVLDNAYLDLLTFQESRV